MKWPWTQWRAETWVRDRERAERWQRGRRRLGRVVAFLGLALIGGPAVFIGVVCSGSGSQAPRDVIAPFPMPSRDESLTFLTVPERLVVAQADEYARHLGRARPSAFPHFTAARAYWGAVSTACGVTSREYSFNIGQQVTLGLLGAGHTVDQLLKGAYEGTLGRAVEWLATNDTPEDKFAAATAGELARFERGAPWQQFPFGTRLQQLWATTPMWGPHVLRKWERRVVLSAEYGIKSFCAAVARLIAATPADKDTARLHAWIGGTTPEALQANGAEVVRAIGPGSFIVTLPRGEAFARSVVGLTGAGARVLDVAGNDEIAITAVIPDAAAAAPGPASGQVLAVDPRLVDPGARLTIRVPTAKIADVFAWLHARKATIEAVLDY